MPKRRSKKSGAKKAAGRVNIPAAFMLLPLPLKPSKKKHAHVYGQSALPPCPPGYTFIGYMIINGVRYCAYRNELGQLIYVAC